MPKWGTSITGCRTKETVSTKLAASPRCLGPEECQNSEGETHTVPIHGSLFCHEISQEKRCQGSPFTLSLGKMSSLQVNRSVSFSSHDETSAIRCLTEINQANRGGKADVQNIPNKALDLEAIPRRWEAHYNSGIENLKAKRFACAATHFEDSLRIMYDIGIDILCIAGAHKGLGLAYASDGKDGKARTHFHKCLFTEAREFGNSDIRLVETSELLGEVCHRIGDYNEAKRNFGRAFGIAKAIWGSKHPKSIELLGSLAKTFYAAGWYNDSLAAYQVILRNTQQAFGHEAVQTADAMNNLALIYRVMLEYDCALALLEAALKIYSGSLVLDQMKSADIANNIGVVYLEQGKLSEAEAYFRRALGIHKQLFRNGHVETIEALENLGITYQMLGQVGKALGYFARVLLIVNKLPPGSRVHNVNMANLYGNIGSLCQALDQQCLASSYFGKCGRILVNRRKLCRRTRSATTTAQMPLRRTKRKSLREKI